MTQQGLPAVEPLKRAHPPATRPKGKGQTGASARGPGAHEGIGTAARPPVSYYFTIEWEMRFWAFLFFCPGVCSPLGLHVMQFSRRDKRDTRARPDASRPPLHCLYCTRDARYSPY